MPNKVIVTSLSHLDTFRTRCQNGGKRWKFIRRTQSSKQNGKVCILLNVFWAIDFRFYVFLTPVLVLFDAFDKLPDFSPNLQVFGVLGLRGLQEGRLEKRETGIRNRNGNGKRNRNLNWNRNRNRKWNRNSNVKGNRYKNRDIIYFKLF